jgi:cell division protein FtsN
MAGMPAPVVASISTTLLVLIAIASVVVLVLIIVAPWKQVREEPPLDKDVETRLLLHRPNPEEPTGELPVTSVRDLSPSDAGGDAGDLAELRDLDDT